MNGIQEGQKVKLKFNKADGSEQELDCLVSHLENELLYLKLSSDMSDYLQYLKEGEELSVTIFTPSGIKVFDSIILNAPDESDFVIEYVEDHEHIQRREYVRVEFYAKLLIEKAGVKPIIAQSIDIGGGGIRFLCDSLFDQNEQVTATLFLPAPMPFVKFQGVVFKHERLSGKQFVLVFTEINERDRDKIIKMCFEIQRSMTAL